MTKSKFNRILTVSLVAFAGMVLGGTSLALASPGAHKNCSGEHKDGAARFQKADKNSDGFITKDEAGAERWERIKVADVNNDGKISQAEMKQAHDEGKLGHHGKKPAA